MASNMITTHKISGEVKVSDSLHRALWKLVTGPIGDIETILNEISEILGRDTKKSQA